MSPRRSHNHSNQFPLQSFGPLFFSILDIYLRKHNSVHLLKLKCNFFWKCKNQNISYLQSSKDTNGVHIFGLIINSAQNAWVTFDIESYFPWKKVFSFQKESFSFHSKKNIVSVMFSADFYGMKYCCNYRKETVKREIVPI